ncbi:ROK family transcriptional regulator [Streptomyces sp. NPDC006798]|uniref:ROK family transcriptional regulator n=1 Tax=Streptomyces sp. NPDC006798 TaxID=3155462 RepID=UPI0033F3731D
MRDDSDETGAAPDPADGGRPEPDMSSAGPEYPASGGPTRTATETGTRTGGGAGSEPGGRSATLPGPTGPTGTAGPAGTAGCGANLPVLRGHNTALLLAHLRDAREHGVSRLGLARRTGLTPQAVSKIVARLRADGLVAEAGRRASTGGKPRTVLRLVPGARHAVGLRIDRDEVTAVLVDLYGTVVAARTAPLDLGAGAPAVVEAAAGEVEALLAAEEPGHLLGTGVAMPGPLDHAAGVTLRITGFPEWDGYPVRDAVATRLAMPVVLDKDTNAGALGLVPGIPPGESFAYLHLGTGLGAGLVLGGAVYRGGRTGAGEFGHQVIQLGADTPPCRCGRRGCIEALCLAAVARGDLPAAARILGAGAANLVALLDIDRVLLGGRIVEEDGAREVFVREAALRSGIPAALANGGPHLIARGAAELVLAPLFGGAAG